MFGISRCAWSKSLHFAVILILGFRLVILVLDLYFTVQPFRFFIIGVCSMFLP